jgi:hypothetical protein
MSYTPANDRLLRALFLQITPCGTRTLYVSGTGSDSNSGLTAATPLRQITTALNQAEAGDLILVDDGTYAYVNCYAKTGNAQKWIAVMAQPGAQPQVNVADSSGDDGMDIQVSSFVGFYGLEIFGNQESRSANPSGIGIFRGSHHIRCWTNLIHDFPGGGINCFWVDATVYNGVSLPGGSWDLLDIAFNTIYGCCKYNPDNTSGISFFAATDMTGGATLDGRYAYRAVGNYIYDCECTVAYTPGGYQFVTDGNGISIDSLWVPNNLDTGVIAYGKRGLIEANIVVGCGGRGLHVYNSINVDDNFNTYIGNLATSSPAINGGVEADAAYSPALTIANGVTHYGNLICPLNTQNTTDGVSTYTDNVILGGSQSVPSDNTSRVQTGTKYFGSAPTAAELAVGLSVSDLAPVMVDVFPRQAGAQGYQALGAGGRAPLFWQAGALELVNPGYVLVAADNR